MARSRNSQHANRHIRQTTPTVRAEMPRSCDRLDPRVDSAWPGGSCDHWDVMSCCDSSLQLVSSCTLLYSPQFLFTLLYCTQPSLSVREPLILPHILPCAHCSFILTRHVCHYFTYTFISLMTHQQLTRQRTPPFPESGHGGLLSIWTRILSCFQQCAHGLWHA